MNLEIASGGWNSLQWQSLVIRFEKRFIRIVLAVTFVQLLIAMPLMSSSVLPTTYALGCSPNIGEFISEGPYASSLQGFTGVSSIVVEKQMINVLMVRPGSVASFKYAYSQALPDRWDFSILLVVRSESALSAPSWLNASFEPSSVVFQPRELVNVTVTFHISKDAPPGDYKLMLAGEFGDQFDLAYCPYAPLNFILRVSPEKPATVTTTQVVSTTATSTMTKTSTAIFTEASTITSIERAPDPSTYAWAVGATVIASVFALVILSKRK